MLATIENDDKDGDGELDLDQVLGPSLDLVLGVADVGVVGDYHVVAALYVEGGGEFQPVSGIDYFAHSDRVSLGKGKVGVKLELRPAP